MLAVVISSTLLGVDGCAVRVEVHISSGVPSFTVVGQPDGACREARDRVRAALLSSGFTWPQQRITVNLAPPGVRKVGAGLDLPIALGVLVASEQCPDDAVNPEGQRWGYVGELGLDGAIRSVPGALPLADAMGADVVVAAPSDAPQVGMAVAGVRSSSHLGELVACLRAEAEWPSVPDRASEPVADRAGDLADVAGQPFARLALEVAAAGGHHLLFVGPPGAGKTMLASRLPSVLGDLGRNAALEVTRVHSAAGLLSDSSDLIRRPPFRAPHHTASTVGLVGGGTSAIRPGELSLAHRGVLFLDELGEFAPRVLDALRQPLEDGRIRISRAHTTVELPADFLLVAASNPCPCGFAPTLRCRCTPGALGRYSRRLSGPLLDRFDLRIGVTRPTTDELMSTVRSEPSAVVAQRVAAARQRAAARGEVVGRGEVLNARLDAASLRQSTPLAADAERLLRLALEHGRLSARGAARARAVALTLADLAGDDPPLSADHVAVALRLRSEVFAASDAHQVGSMMEVGQ